MADGNKPGKEQAPARRRGRLRAIAKVSKCEDGQHPIDRVAGILDRLGGPAIPFTSVDDYIEEIRGR